MPSRILVPQRPALIKPPRLARLDTSHPLSKGLISFFLLQEGAGKTVYDLAKPGRTSTLAANASWKTTPYGLAVKPGSSATDKNTFSSNPTTSGAPFTVEIMLQHTGSDATFAGLLTDLTTWGCYIHGNHVDLDGGADPDSTATLATGGFYQCIWYWDGSNAGYAINGIRDSGGAANTGISNPAAFTGWGGDGTNQASNNTIIWFRIWQRLLSDQETAGLHADPFAMLYVPGERIRTYAILGALTGSTTTQKTLSSTARITATTSKTLTSTARIQITSTKTLTSVARIQLITQKTLTSTARITATTQKTLSSTARITATTQRTLTSTARITATTPRTLTSIARIQRTTQKTLTSTANIVAAGSTQRTLTSTARIQKSATQQLSSTARIQRSTSQTLTSVARITAKSTKTLTSTARVTATTLKTLSSTARLQITTQRQLTSVARLQRTMLRTLTSTAAIVAAGAPLPFPVIGSASLGGVVIAQAASLGAAPLAGAAALTGMPTAGASALAVVPIAGAGALGAAPVAGNAAKG